MKQYFEQFKNVTWKLRLRSLIQLLLFFLDFGCERKNIKWIYIIPRLKYEIHRHLWIFIIWYQIRDFNALIWSGNSIGRCGKFSIFSSSLKNWWKFMDFLESSMKTHETPWSFLIGLWEKLHQNMNFQHLKLKLWTLSDIWYDQTIDVRPPYLSIRNETRDMPLSNLQK